MKFIKVAGFILLLVLTISTFSLLLKAEIVIESFGKAHAKTCENGCIEYWCDNSDQKVCKITIKK